MVDYLGLTCIGYHRGMEHGVHCCEGVNHMQVDVSDVKHNAKHH